MSPSHSGRAWGESPARSASTGSEVHWPRAPLWGQHTRLGELSAKGAPRRPPARPWDPRAPSVTCSVLAGGDQEQEQQRCPEESGDAGDGGGGGAGHGAQLGGSGRRCLERESWRESWRSAICGSRGRTNPFYPWLGRKVRSPGGREIPGAAFGSSFGKKARPRPLGELEVGKGGRDLLVPPSLASRVPRALRAVLFPPESSTRVRRRHAGAAWKPAPGATGEPSALGTDGPP